MAGFAKRRRVGIYIAAFACGRMTGILCACPGFTLKVPVHVPTRAFQIPVIFLPRFVYLIII